MRTIDMSPEEMAHYIARFDDLQANKARTAGTIPPEAREALLRHGHHRHLEASEAPEANDHEGDQLRGEQEHHHEDHRRLEQEPEHAHG